jgi:hypothetical protein
MEALNSGILHSPHLPALWHSCGFLTHSWSPHSHSKPTMGRVVGSTSLHCACLFSGRDPGKDHTGFWCSAGGTVGGGVAEAFMPCFRAQLHRFLYTVSWHQPAGLHWYSCSGWAMVLCRGVHRHTTLHWAGSPDVLEKGLSRCPWTGRGQRGIELTGCMEPDIILEAR